MIKFQLKAVTIRGRIICNRGKTGISLRTDSDLIKSFAINLYIAFIIFFLDRILQHIIPVILIHDNIDADYAVRIK